MVMKAVVGKHPDLKDAIHIDGDTVAVNLDEIDNAKAFTRISPSRRYISMMVG